MRGRRYNGRCWMRCLRLSALRIGKVGWRREEPIALTFAGELSSHYLLGFVHG
jgi:hypothetical protein